MLYPGIEETLTSLLQKELPKCEIRIARDPTAHSLSVTAATRYGPQLIQATMTIAYYALDSYTRKNNYLLREIARCVRRDLEMSVVDYVLGGKGENVAPVDPQSTSEYAVKSQTAHAQTYQFPIVDNIQSIYANWMSDYYAPGPIKSYIPGTVDYSRDLAKALDKRVRDITESEQFKKNVECLKNLAFKPTSEQLIKGENKNVKTVYEIYAVEIATEEVTGPYLITAKSREEAKIELFRQHLKGKVGDYALGFREVVCFEPKKEEK